jgi:hypothetical protein
MQVQKVSAQAGEFTEAGFVAHPRKFSASESDIIFNANYITDGIDFATVADWLQDITGKTTTAAEVEAEFVSRM